MTKYFDKIMKLQENSAIELVEEIISNISSLYLCGDEGDKHLPVDLNKYANIISTTYTSALILKEKLNNKNSTD